MRKNTLTFTFKSSFYKPFYKTFFSKKYKNFFSIFPKWRGRQQLFVRKIFQRQLRLILSFSSGWVLKAEAST